MELAEVDDDEDTIAAVTDDLVKHEGALATLEFRRMFSGEMDGSDAYLDIQSGSGGTEAQDWAEMLLRMYLRWGERRGFKAELIERRPATLRVSKARPSTFKAIMLTVGCEPSQASTVW